MCYYKPFRQTQKVMHDSHMNQKSGTEPYVVGLWFCFDLIVTVPGSFFLE